MTQTTKLCCDWRKLIWDCLISQNQSEWFKVTEGWFRCGQLNLKTFSVEFPNCPKCQVFFTKFFPTGQNLEQKLANLKKMGCCQLLPIIYDLDDNTVPERVEIYEKLLAQQMCLECQEIIDLAKQKQMYQTKNE